MAFHSRTSVPLITAALLLGTLLVYELYAPKGERTDIALYPDDLQMIEDGERLYAEHCASCHGPNLAGENNWRERKSNGRLPAPPRQRLLHRVALLQSRLRRRYQRLRVRRHKFPCGPISR